MTGSIEKRGKDSYRLVVFKGYDLDGKSIRHQKTIHCKNKSEARTELAKYIAEVENGFIVEGNVPTFKEFVEIWKRDYGQKELAPSTYYRYLGILESRILPYFGHFKLNKNNELSHIFSETAHFAFYIKLKLVGNCINHFLCFFPTEARVGN